MKRPAALLAVAAACVAAGAWLISVTWHVSLGHGLYCAVGTASTVGCDTAPHSAAGWLAAVAVMLTAIPALAGCFALVTGAHVHKRVSARVAEAETRLKRDADGRHLLMQQHVERLLKGHCADLKAHVSTVVADAQVNAGAGLAAGKRVTPPAATSRKPKGTA
jgi:hypothetical protein